MSNDYAVWPNGSGLEYVRGPDGQLLQQEGLELSPEKVEQMLGSNPKALAALLKSRVYGSKENLMDKYFMADQVRAPYQARYDQAIAQSAGTEGAKKNAPGMFPPNTTYPASREERLVEMLKKTDMLKRMTEDQKKDRFLNQTLINRTDY